MYLRELRLYHFRNFDERTIAFHPQVNLITGKNGQGKSNLIEAIHFLSATRSFRSARLKELQQWDGGEFSVYGITSDSESERQLGITYSKGSRKVYVNGDIEKSAADYVRIFPVVTFAPRDIDLIFGSPSGRRKFIDRYAALLSPQYFSSLAAYQKLIKSKGVLLKSGYPDKEQIATLNVLIAENAVRVIQGRRDLFENISLRCKEIYKSFAEDDGSLTYQWKETHQEHHQSPILEKEIFEEILAQIMNQEIARRTTLVGPHLDDIEFLLEAHEARSYASQGQARSIVLALLVALVQIIEEELQKPPVLLLDDFSSELDHGRMTKFFSLLTKTKNQAFITGTELSADVFGSDEYGHYSVSDGSISTL